MSQNTYVYYHSADYDGIASGNICQYFLRKSGIEPIMVGWDYGTPVGPIPDANSKVYVVDLSIPELMDHPNLVWIDHHKSAIMEYGQKMASGYRIDGVAACRLCWQWFTTNKNLPSKYQFEDRHVIEPFLITLLGEYDIWDKRDTNAELLQLGLKTEEVGFDWQKVLKDYDVDLNNNYEMIHNLCDKGRIIQKYNTIRDAEFMAVMSFDTEFEGLQIKAFNGRGNSLTFQLFDDTDGIDCYSMFYFLGDKYKYSLYHHPKRKDLDLSLIAKKYGGGGHAGACGFETKELVYNKKEKHETKQSTES